MIVLITGGSGSGKSEYAEKLTMELGTKNMCYYIATMEKSSDEAEKRIKRHRKLREDKPFVTIEKPYAINELELDKGATILLECVSNLLANELYMPYRERKRKETSIAKGIVEEILSLTEKCENAVLVTNDIFSDGCTYDDEVRYYIEELGKINQLLAQKADLFIEVVCGIPVVWKGKQQ